MPEYEYEAKDFSGQIIKGTLEAENTEQFYSMLKERNQFCIKVREAGAKSKEIYFSGKRIRLKDLNILCRQFSTMLGAGLTVIKCLDILYQQTSNKRIKSIILSIYESVQRGDSLSKAMKEQEGAFPLLLLNMIEAGEASGSLDTVMERMANQYEKENRMQNKVRQALIYPAFLAGLSVIIVVFLLTFVLPRFLSMFSQMKGKLPVATRILLAASNGITGYWYLIIAVIVLIVLLCRAFLKSPFGRLAWDRMKLHAPVFGKLSLVVESSRFARTMASLYSSGIPVVQSLEIVGKVIGNRYIQVNLNKVIEDVRRGITISASMKRINLFPVMLSSMISIGEESGNMDEILNKTAAFYDEESEAAISRMISLIEPVMIVILAVIVGFIIISIITPIYSLYNQVYITGSM